jgi:hypothetical protein
MSAGELVMRCFHARTTAHVLHLKTRSYAAHKALQDFYDGVIPLVDSFAEAYQGDYGLIENYAYKYVPYSDALELMDDLSDWIEQNRASICDEDDTYLQNVIDEIVALLRSTQYKLRFLK